MHKREKTLLALYCVGAALDSSLTYLLVVGVRRVVVPPNTYLYFLELNPRTAYLLGTPLFWLRELVMVLFLYLCVKLGNWIIERTNPKPAYLPSSSWPILVLPVAIRWWAALNNILSLVIALVRAILAF